eukprot:UN15757
MVATAGFAGSFSGSLVMESFPKITNIYISFVAQKILQNFLGGSTHEHPFFPPLFSIPFSTDESYHVTQ